MGAPRDGSSSSARARPPGPPRRAPKAPPPPPPATSGTTASAAQATPGSTAPPTPAAAAAGSGPSAHPLQLAALTSAPKAQRRGRPGRPRRSDRQLAQARPVRDPARRLRRRLHLRGARPHRAHLHDRRRRTPRPRSTAVAAAASASPTPEGPASAGIQSPSRCKVSAPQARKLRIPGRRRQSDDRPRWPPTGVPAGMGRARCSRTRATPTPRAAVVAKAAERARESRADRTSAAAQGLGRGQRDRARHGDRRPRSAKRAPALRDPARRRLRPRSTPDPMLSNWAQLQAALHPQGAKAAERAARRDRQRRVPALASSELQRACCRTRGSRSTRCGRRDIAGGPDRQARARRARVPLAQRAEPDGQRAALRAESESPPPARRRPPTRATRATSRRSTASRSPTTRAPGSITDLTIRTLLTLPAAVRARTKIVSLMRYPEPSNTQLARRLLEPHPARLRRRPARGSGGFGPRGSALAASPDGTPTFPDLCGGSLSTSQWEAS